MADSAALESLLLSSLINGDIHDSYEFASVNSIDHQKLVGIVKSLEGDGYVASEGLTAKFWELSEEGMKVAQQGSPEFQVLKLRLPTVAKCRWLLSKRP